ncbi:putative Outer membrane adhesin like proteiin [Candidatus Terasakiella magnetica]|uniref:Putative Outer membrane adhesin like proteiin n=1 Tax=Candidatus Terasakiella magnetica TaxID=1867952 RepID=A0A1C3RKN0_9PROT|nr:putative Outer membrane adhesin like proteiin [Candidatus Terasakiella magnetica]
MVGEITLPDGVEYNTYTLTEEQLLANATDIDGDSLEVTEVSGGTNLAITDNGDGTWTIISSEEGLEGIDFKVTDGTETVEQSATINFADVDNTAVDDTASTTQGESVTLNVADLLDNDNIIDGGTITSVQGAENGTVSLSEDGTTVTFTPAEGYDGSAASFTYTVTDEDGETTTATVNVDVADLDNTLVDDAASLNEDGSKTLNVLSNDQIVDGGEVTSVSQPDNGSVSINEDGTVTYTPDEDWNGTESFTYTVTDDDGETATATVTMTVNPENDDPIVGEIELPAGTEYQTYTVTEEQLLANTTDVDSSNLDVTSITGGSNLTINDNGDGTWTIISDEEGLESIEFTVSDGENEVSQTTTINFADVDNTAVDDTASTTQGEPVTLNVADLLENDNIIDGGTITSVQGAENGTVSLSEDGTTVTFTPAEGYDGSAASFTYTVTDEDGETTTATVNVDVADLDNTLVDDAASLNEDGSKTLNVLSNDQIVDGGEVTSVSQPDNGTVSINDDGTVTYTPDEDWNGTESFTYTVTDDDGETATATVTMTVNPENDDPIAVDDISTTDEDQPVVINLLGNDTDLDGDTLSITKIDGQDIVAGETITLSDGSGTVTLNDDGTVTYDPADDLAGDVDFSYTISDGQGGTDTATATVSIDEINDGPVALDDAFSGLEDNAITFTANDLLGNDSDIDSDVLSVAQINGVSLESFPSEGMDLGDGTLSYDSENATFTFNPTEDWSGTESLSYTVSDGEGGSAQANIALTTEGVADTPDLAVSIVESDHSGDSVTITFQGSDAGYHNTYGYYVLDENGEPSTGEIIFADLHDQSVGDTFTLDGVNEDNVGFFLISDGDGENVGLLNGMDVSFAQDDEGNWQVLDPTGTSLNHDDNGGLYFTNEEFNEDGLDHAFDDGDVAGEQNWEDQESQYGGNDFDFNDASFNVDWDYTNTETTYDVNISAAITDDDLSETLSITIDSFPEGATFNMGEIVDGKLVIEGEDLDNLEDLTMTVSGEAEDFNIDVTATATEPNGSSASTSLTVGPNFDPDAIDDQASVTEGQSITMDLVSNDTDADGDSLNITEIDGQDIAVGETVDVDNGTVTLNGDGSITFAADNGYEGPADFSYTISDGQGGTDSATVNLDITDGNIAPVAEDDSATTDEDTAVTIDLLDNDSDANNDNLTITQIDGQDIAAGETINLSDGSGSVTLNADGTVSYDPADDINGEVNFGYTVTDPEGMSDSATVTVEIEAENDGPVANADSADTLEDNAVTFNPLGNDTDVENDALSITQIDGQDIVAGGTVDVGNGTVELNEDGTVTFTPDEHYAGTESFDYTVSDGQGGTSTATATVDVEADADAPLISIDIGSPEAVSGDGGVAGGTVTGDDVSNGTVSGVTISGLDSEGNPSPVEQVVNGHGDGIGVAGHTTGSKDLLGYDSREDASETLIFEFDEDVNNVSFDVEQFGEGGNGNNASYEQGTWEAYDDGQLVASGTFDGLGLNNADDTASVTIDGVSFDKLVVQADTTINADGSTAAGDSDFAINNLEFTHADATGEVEYYDYPLDVSAQLVDQDGSESLSDVSLTGLPEGAILSQDGVEITITDGSATLSSGDLDGLSLRVPADADDFSLEASVTTTDSNGDQETSVANDSAIVPDMDINNDPVANADSAEVLEDNSVTFFPMGNDTDADGDELSITQVAGQDIVAGGSVDIGDGVVTLNENGSVTFTPDGDYSGTETFEYTVSDGQGGSQTAIATVEVEADADVPDLTVSLGEGETTTTGGSPVDVTINSDNVTSSENGFSVTGRSINSDGTLSDASSDNIDFNSSPLGFGVEGSASGANSEIGYSDNHEVSEELIVDFDTDVSSIDVSVAWLNGGEDAVYTMYNDGVEVGSGLIDGGSDGIDPAITLTADGNADFDQVVFSAPDSGDDFLIHSIDFVASDGGETTTTYPLNITSNLNDTDGSESLSLIVDGLPEGAVLSAGTQNEDGSWTLSADDLDGLNVTVPGDAGSFSVEVSSTAIENSNGDSETVTASVNVEPNVGPEAQDDSFTATEDVGETFDLVANDSDANGDSLTITQIGGADIGVGETVEVENGSVTLNADGSINFMPSSNFSGDVSFDYTVSDGQGGSDTATATIDVEGVADGVSVGVDIGAGSVQTTVLSGETATLTESNYDSLDGVTITGSDEGTTSSSVVRTESSGGGWFGIENGGGDKAIQDNEQLIVSFDNDISDATIKFKSLGNNDEGNYTLYNNGVVVGSGNIGSDDDTLAIAGDNNQAFDQIVIEGDSGKFKVKNIEYSEAGGTLTSVEYPVTFALTMHDDSEALVGGGLSVDLSTVPHGSELTIGDATITVSDNGTISVTSGDDVSVDGTTMMIPSGTLGEDLSVSGTLSVPADDSAHHDTFDLTATAQSVDGTDTSLEAMDLDVAGTSTDEIGTAGDDILSASGSEDAILSGQAGDDVLNGGDGNDILLGGEGADTMIGGGGNDTFMAPDDAADDVMNGGAGEDLFIFNSQGNAGTSGNDWVDGGEDFDTIQLNGTEGWTMTITGVDGGEEVISSDGAQMSDYQDVSGLTGQIEFEDGSTVLFEGVEKVEW